MTDRHTPTRLLAATVDTATPASGRSALFLLIYFVALAAALAAVT